MESIIDQQLSDELQDLFLQNKQWLSDVQFYEDEARFFKNMSQKASAQPANGKHSEQIADLNAKISTLDTYLRDLKSMVIHHRKMLESLLDKSRKDIGMELLEENSEITKKIKTLFQSVHDVKNDLVGLADSNNEKA